ncbi:MULTISPECIES: hypothetical protein [unclassified Thioalkalivibrio]|uniref:hypothetical protein n=1 Tax=unclassified Thioalkalivibrio TaxID=2621013 RepID=UPI000475909C|nr:MULTISPECIES: hypothetical protein [unclassified Thioalkalivibrio]
MKRPLINIQTVKEDSRKMGVGMIVASIVALFLEAVPLASVLYVITLGVMLLVIGNIQINEEES